MTKFNDKKLQAGVRLILEGIGVKLTDPDFQDTPKRVSRYYQEILSPKPLDSLVSFPANYSEMVVLRNHLVHTLCPHHLLPVEMNVSLGYLPGETVIGLSKLARICESVLTKPMKQEEFTDLVVTKLKTLAKPRGIGIHVLGQHGCMRHRGVQTRGDVVTSSMQGQFLMNAATRQEFLTIIGAGK